MTDGTVESLAELQGTKCRCGEMKMAKDTFCCVCYHKLPKRLQRGLYRRLANGYMLYYKAAVRFLEELKAEEAAAQ